MVKVLFRSELTMKDFEGNSEQPVINNLNIESHEKSS